MKKTTMKVSALLVLLAMLAGCVSIGAIAEGGDILDISDTLEQKAIPPEVIDLQGTQEPSNPSQSTSPASDVIAVDETQDAGTTYHRVTFFDLYGWEYAWYDVAKGSAATAPEYPPHLEGFMFHYWYDEADPLRSPFAFDTRIDGDVRLLPYYTSLSALVDSVIGSVSTTAQSTVATAGQVANLISEVVGSGAQTSQGDTGAVLLDALLSGAVKAEAKPTPAPQPVQAMPDTQVETLIADLLSGAQATEPVELPKIIPDALQGSDILAVEPIDEEPQAPGAEDDDQDQDIEDIISDLIDPDTEMEDPDAEEDIPNDDILDEDGLDEDVDNHDDEAIDPALPGDSEVDPDTEEQQSADTGAQDDLIAETPSIIISANVPDVVAYGDTIELRATVDEAVESPDTLRWQYDAGAGWVDAGATGLTHSFVLDADNYYWTWRLVSEGTF